MRDLTNSRREFLRMIGMSGAAMSLAACAPAASPTATTQPASASTPAATTAASAPTAAAAGTKPAATGGSAMSARVGYLPITDAAPLLLAHARGLYAGEALEVPKPTLLRSWAQVAEAFQSRQVDIVHILMPTAIWMRFSQNFPVKIVAWDHTDGSALTVGNDVNSLDDLVGTTVAVPFWYSIHNLVLQLMMRKSNLKPIITGDASKADRTVKLVVMAPPDMPPALSNGTISGYIVADPFNAVAEINNVGKVHRFIGDVWLNHACCVVIMHEEDTVSRPEWAQSVVTAVAKAQVWARENRKEAARLLSKEGGDYLPQPLPVIERAMGYYDLAEYGKTGAIKHPDWDNNRIDFQPFPFPSYTEELVKLLKETTVEGDAAFLQSLDPAKAHETVVDDRFARAAIQAAGGPDKFGIPASLSRTERIEV